MREVTPFYKLIEIGGRKLLLRIENVVDFATGDRIEIGFINQYSLAASEKKFEEICQNKGIFKTKEEE